MVLLQDGETLSWCDDNIAVGSVELTGKNLQECGFAGTVGTDQTVAVSLCKFNIYIFKSCFLTDTQSHIVCTNHF